MRTIRPQSSGSTRVRKSASPRVSNQSALKLSFRATQIRRQINLPFFKSGWTAQTHGRGLSSSTAPIPQAYSLLHACQPRRLAIPKESLTSFPATNVVRSWPPLATLLSGLTCVTADARLRWKGSLRRRYVDAMMSTTRTCFR